MINTTTNNNYRRLVQICLADPKKAKHILDNGRVTFGLNNTVVREGEKIILILTNIDGTERYLTTLAFIRRGKDHFYANLPKSN